MFVLLFFVKLTKITFCFILVVFYGCFLWLFSSFHLLISLVNSTYAPLIFMLLILSIYYYGINLCVF